MNELKIKLVGVYKLSRIWEHLGTTLILAITGIALAGTFNYISLPLVITANVFVSIFAYMINDIEDAEDDALDPKKKFRNPISAGKLSKNEGYIISFLIAVIGALIFAFISSQAFIVVVSSIVIGFLYSWKRIRLKSKPIVDVVSHGYFLSGAIFLSSFLAFSSFEMKILYPMLIFSLFSFGSSLHNQTRDFEVDRKSGLTNTASILGYKPSLILQNIFFYSSMLLGTFFVYQNRHLVNIYVASFFIFLIFVLTFVIVVIKKKSLVDYDKFLHVLGITALLASLLF